jgi:hypothetical protein
MSTKFVIAVIAASVFNAVAEPGQLANPKLTNADIVQMQSAGLGADVITEKILSSSTCDFDTSAAALVQLKDSGLPDSVLIAMLRCQQTAPVTDATKASTTLLSEPKMAPLDSPTPDGLPRGYVLAYVKSDRKWKLGFRSEPYDKISEYFQDQLSASLGREGVQRLPLPEGACCKLTIELLEVTTHPAAIKKPGIDVTANVTVGDASGRLIYSKGYRGESRTMMNTWGHLINHAVEDMVMNISRDEVLLKALGTGRL